MNLGNCQSTIAAALAGSTLFSEAGLRVWDSSNAANGTGIVIDDGTGNRQGVDDSLLRGLCLVVGPPRKGQQIDAVDGKCALKVLFSVTVAEVPTQNFGQNGFKIGTFAALDEIISRVSKNGGSLVVQRNPKPESFTVGDPKDGQWMSVVTFSVTMFWA